MPSIDFDEAVIEILDNLSVEAMKSLAILVLQDREDWVSKTKELLAKEGVTDIRGGLSDFALHTIAIDLYARVEAVLEDALDL